MIGDPPTGCRCCCHGPASYFHSTNATLSIPEPSISEIRDDAANAALTGLLMSFTEKDREQWNKLYRNNNARIAQEFARHAYEIADAMMEQRKPVATSGGKHE